MKKLSIPEIKLNKKDQIINVISSLKSENKTATFSELVSKIYKDKIIEIYFGDIYEQINLADFSPNVFISICGKIIDAHGDCLFIDSYYVDEDKEIKSGNIVTINGYNVKAILEVDGSGQLKDILLSTRSTKKIGEHAKHK